MPSAKVIAWPTSLPGLMRVKARTYNSHGFRRQELRSPYGSRRDECDASALAGFRSHVCASIRPSLGFDEGIGGAGIREWNFFADPPYPSCEPLSYLRKSKGNLSRRSLWVDSGGCNDHAGDALPRRSPARSGATQYDKSSVSFRLWNRAYLGGRICAIFRDSRVPGCVFSIAVSPIRSSYSGANSFQNNRLFAERKCRCGRGILQPGSRSLSAARS